MTALPLSLGFSPCPNDTFMFYGLVHGKIAMPEEVVLAPPELQDVETLNQWALAGRLAVTKISYHAYGHVTDRYRLLQAGSALGRGCGPLLVGNADGGRLERMTIAVPGRYTTAAMLLRLFAPEVVNIKELRFDTIPAAIAGGVVDAGVIIHESRFTYQQHGLTLLQDLGAWWEGETGLPIPLGGIAVQRHIPDSVCRVLERGLAASVRWARGHSARVMPYIRQHAQELDDQVISEHIALYVNAFSVDLGEEGRAAVAEFLARGRKVGLF